MTPAPAYGPPRQPAVSVVVAHYDDPAGLNAVLEGLGTQDYPGPVQVVIADDGSTVPPRVAPVVPGTERFDVVIVYQADRGFRLAAARNLGARAAMGEILIFLDGDTVPGPGYLTAVVGALEAVPKAVVVGTRTHLDLGAEPPRDLGEPAWLTEGWSATDDLRGGDETNFRFMIGAVLSCRREVFEAVGGFDETIVGYGGEDWEFAWQAHLAGFDLRHEPAARAAHRGADWGARSRGDPVQAIHQKNLETIRLSSRITHPTMRAAGVVHGVPDIQVRWVPGDGERPPGPGVTESVVADLLASGDAHVRVVTRENLDVFAADPRVEVVRDGVEGRGGDPWTLTGRVRPRFRVELSAPCRIPAGDLQRTCEEVAATGSCAEVVTGEGQVLCRIRPERAVARRQTQMRRVVRAWPVIEGGIRLEDEFRRSGSGRLEQ